MYGAIPGVYTCAAQCDIQGLIYGLRQGIIPGVWRGYIKGYVGAHAWVCTKGLCNAFHREPCMV